MAEKATKGTNKADVYRRIVPVLLGEPFILVFQVPFDCSGVSAVQKGENCL